MALKYLWLTASQQIEFGRSGTVWNRAIHSTFTTGGCRPGIDYKYCDYPRVEPGSRLRSVGGATPCAEYTSAGASRSVVRLVKLLSVALIRSYSNFSSDKSILYTVAAVNRNRTRLVLESGKTPVSLKPTTCDTGAERSLLCT